MGLWPNWLRQSAHNRWIAGSSPAGPTKRSNKVSDYPDCKYYIDNKEVDVEEFYDILTNTIMYYIKCIANTPKIIMNLMEDMMFKDLNYRAPI